MRKERPVRIVLVPDTTEWAIGRQSLQLARIPSRHERFLWSEAMIRADPDGFVDLVRSADVLHWLSPWGQRKHEALIRDHVWAVASTLHHDDHPDLVGVVARADAIMTCSSQWTDHLVGRGIDPERVGCVPYGVDCEFFRPVLPRDECRRRLGLPVLSPLVGYVGGSSTEAVRRRKGLSAFREAMGEVARRIPEVELLVCGLTSEESLAAFREPGVPVHVRYYEDDRNLPLVYGALDVLLVTSVIEGGPLTVLEAMACARAVVTTPVGIVRDALQPGTDAIVVPQGDPAAAAREVSRLLADPALARAVGRRGRLSMMRSHRWEHRAEALDAFYQRVVRAARARIGTDGLDLRPRPRVSAARQVARARMVDRYLWGWRMARVGNWRSLLAFWFGEGTRVEEGARFAAWVLPAVLRRMAPRLAPRARRRSPPPAREPRASRPLRILVLLRALEIGGGQVNTVRLAVELSRRGHDVCVASDEGPLGATLRQAGVPLVVLPLDRKGFRPSLGIVRSLVRLVRERRADCLYNGEITSESMIEAHLVSLWTGAPLLQTDFGNWLTPLHRPRVGPLLVTKPYMVDDLVDLGWPRESILLWEARIPTGIHADPERAREFRSAAGAGPEHFLAATVCRLDRTWNLRSLRFLLDAVRVLQGEDPSSRFRLALVGDGPGREEITAHARDLGLAGTDLAPVRFLGAMVDPLPAYAGCDLYIGRGSSILRAMSMAVPCLALGVHYSRPVAREFFEELTYYEFTRNLRSGPGALPELVATLRRLMDVPEIRVRMAREGRELVEERYDLENGAGQIEEWLRELVCAPRSVSPAKACLEVGHALADLVRYRIRRRFGHPIPALPSRQGLPFEA